ncbi:MAG: hypothetical protein NTZ36_03085 [Candidatus Jorgensenbacteria bacterium]|nr:hypothetical protein [Candidatus Jorgensenbacteria bacterium]
MNNNGFSSRVVVITMLVALVILGAALGLKFYLDSKTSNTPMPGDTTGLPNGGTTVKKPILNDCGTTNSFECFASKAKNCTKAIIGYGSQSVSAGVSVESTITLNIAGYQDSKCVFSVKVDSASASLSQDSIKKMQATGVTSDQIAAKELELSKMAKASVGRSGVCNFLDTNNLTVLLTKWQTGRVTPEDFKYLDCKGEYFGQGIQAANTSTKITSAECSAKAGVMMPVSPTGTACFSNQSDLGSVSGIVKGDINAPQCCVAK